MKHGYTNKTSLTQSGDFVKSFLGSGAEVRLQREKACMTRLRGILPVPRVHSHSAQELVMEYVDGVNCRDLIDGGFGESVFTLAGKLLRQIQNIPLDLLPELEGSGVVICHGDFVPGNLLIDPLGSRIVGIVDWERARLGDPLEDIAWFEWAVRAFQPEAVHNLGSFFNGYGLRPFWANRMAKMLSHCEVMQLIDPIEREGCSKAFWQRWKEQILTWKPLDSDA